jgi:hypothetical protein
MRALLVDLRRFRALGYPEAAWWDHLAQVVDPGNEDGSRAAKSKRGRGDKGDPDKPLLPEWLDPPIAAEAIPKDVPIAVDTETFAPGKILGRVPVPWDRGARLVCVGFTVGGRRFVHLADDRDRIQQILSLPNVKVFHSCIYDLVWLRWSEFTVAGVVHDTYRILALANGAGAHTLDEAGAFRYPVHLPKETPALGQVLTYCGNDTRNTASLFDPSSPWLRHALYLRDQRMTPRLVELALQGIPVFSDRIEAGYHEAQNTQGTINEQLREIASINWRSYPQLVKLFGDTLPKRLTRKGRPSTKKAVLRECPHPAAAPLLAKRQVDRDLTSFFEPLHGQSHAHGLISINAAITGRTSSASINLQNIRDTTVFRSMFGAVGWDWVALDYKGAELVVAAGLSGCVQLLAWFRQGRDPYRYTAAELLRKSVGSITDLERDLAKTVTLAILYGGTAQTIVERAQLAGLAVSLKEAQAFRTAVFQMFPEIRRWQQAIDRQIIQGKPIGNPFGRQWMIAPRSWHERNFALNAPVQSTASDLFLFGVDAVWDRLPGRAVNLVHDELDVLIPNGSFDEHEWRVIVQAMTGPYPQFPLAAKVSCGPDWGSLETKFTAGAFVSIASTDDEVAVI